LRLGSHRYQLSFNCPPRYLGVCLDPAVASGILLLIPGYRIIYRGQFPSSGPWSPFFRNPALLFDLIFFFSQNTFFPTHLVLFSFKSPPYQDGAMMRPMMLEQLRCELLGIMLLHCVHGSTPTVWPEEWCPILVE
jgi:hypothetical protein